MKASIPQLIAIPICFLSGWLGSSFFRPDSQPGDSSTNTAATTSLLGSRSRTSGSFAHLLDESASYSERLLAMAEHPALSSGDFHQRLRDLSKLPETTLRQDALTELIEDWIQHNVTAAFTACEGLEDNYFRSTALQRVIWAWSVYDPEAALERVLALPKEHKQRAGFIRDAARKIGKDSPRRALDILTSENVEPPTDFESIYKALAEEDLNEAIARLKDSKFQLAWKGVMTVWLERDQTAAIKHFATEHSLQHWDARDVMKQLLPQMRFDKPSETHELLAASLHPESWKELQEAFAQAWFAKDPEATAAWVADVEEDGLRDSMTRAIGVSLAKESPSEAFQFLVDQGQNGRISHATKLWAEQDWDAAYAQISAFEGTPKTKALAASGLLASLSPEMTTEHIRELLSFTEAQKEPPYIDELLPRLGPDDLGELLDSYPASIAPAMRNYLSELVEHDPQEAVAIASHLPEKERDRALGEMTVQWVANDPDGAATWLRTLPEGESRVSAYRNYMNALTRSYPDAASEWIESVPQDLKERTVEEYIGVTIPQNPHAALDELLKHAPHREALIRRAMVQYHLLEPEAARKRLSEFKGDLRAEIEKRFESNDAWSEMGQ